MISTLMIFTNELNADKEPPRAALETLVLLMSPIAPHLAEELWQRLGHEPTVSRHPWPEFDPALVVDDVVEIAVQVNGKVRGRIALPVDASESDATTAALELDSVRKFTDAGAVRKTIYRAGKILNLIVK